VDEEKEKPEEIETCTGQCGYAPICRQCELEKKKLMMKKFGKPLPDEGPSRNEDVP
jgi:hypothetical protein